MSLLRAAMTGGIIGIAVAAVVGLWMLLDQQKEEEEQLQVSQGKTRSDQAEGRSSSLRDYSSCKSTNRSARRDDKFWNAYASTTYERECVLCLHNKADTGFLHGQSLHVCMCEGCMMEYLKTGTAGQKPTCPLCRQSYERILRV